MQIHRYTFTFLRRRFRQFSSRVILFGKDFGDKLCLLLLLLLFCILKGSKGEGVMEEGGREKGRRLRVEEKGKVGETEY